ncbi:MAG: hypothetical protein DRP63_09925, partial [Planctomycetota bacterium]
MTTGGQKRLSEYGVGDDVKGRFVLLWPRRMKGGALYFWLADDSGKVRARYSGTLSPQNGTIVEVSGKVVDVWGSLWIEVGHMVAVTEQVDKKQFIPKGRFDIAEAEEQFKRIAESVSGVLGKLLRSFFEDRSFWESFRRAPAAKSVHQAYEGGLLLHTLGVVRLCHAACTIYPRLRRDLLVTAALLHDVGKVWEYKLFPRLDKTDAGRLVGHVVLGAQEVSRRAREVGVPTDTRLLLEHLILSHHGRREWGSPVEPAVAEAELLHYADMIDSRVAIYS